MALTTLPSAGAKLRSSVLSSLITELRPLKIVKSADESITASTAYQDDDELVLAVEANRTYFGRLQIVFASPAAADFKVSATAPSGATLNDWMYIYQGVVDTAGPTTGVTAIPGNGAGSKDGFSWAGVLVVSSTAGNVQWRWAQVVSDAGATTVYAKSFFELRMIE